MAGADSGATLLQKESQVRYEMPTEIPCVIDQGRGKYGFLKAYIAKL